jgi:transmembrane sensor
MLEPASEAEVEAFEAWLHADPKHGEAYAQVESLAALSSRLPRRLLAAAPSARTQAVLRPAFAVATAVLLIVASALVLTGQGRQAAYAAIANPGPAVRGFTLVDGTTVVLDSGARLAVSFERDARTITLQSGRVRFNIARDARRPFAVKAARATLRTSAAMVDVTLRGGEVQILVLDGEVALTASDAPKDRNDVSIEDGTAVRIIGGQISDTAVEPGATRWPEARLAFDDARLATIVQLANRRGSPKIELADGAIGELRVTGVLDIRDTASLARKLAATLDLRVEDRSDRIRISR